MLEHDYQTFGDKHAQQFLQDSGQGSEQAACHASAQPRVCLLPSDVILSEAKDLRGGVTSSLFAALTAVLEELLRMLLSKCLLPPKKY